jgi:hypothetical protein
MCNVHTCFKKCPEKFNYKKGDYSQLRQSLKLDWCEIFGSLHDNLEKKWQFFKDLLCSSVEQHIPKINNYQTWKKQSWKRPLDEKLRVKIRQKSRLWTRFIETRRPEILRKYKTVSNQIRNDTRKLIKKEQCEVAKQCKVNPKKLWNYINSKTRSSTRIGDLKDVDVQGHNIVVREDQDKANALANFFSKVYTTEPDKDFRELDPKDAKISFSNISFENTIILDKLSKINVNKSPGTDTIHPRILYEVRHEIALPLRLIYEDSYRLGVIPSDWSLANTVPIHKKGSKTELNNYRPEVFFLLAGNMGL